MNFYWNITKLNTTQTETLQDVVTSIDYEVFLEKENLIESQKGTVELAEPEQPSFIAFESLTEEQVKNWLIERRGGSDMMEVLHMPQLSAKINLKLEGVNTAPTPRAVPWGENNE